MQEDNSFMKTIIDKFDRPSTAKSKKSEVNKRKSKKSNSLLEKRREKIFPPNEGWLTITKMESSPNDTRKTISESKRRQEATTQATLIADSL